MHACWQFVFVVFSIFAISASRKQYSKRIIETICKLGLQKYQLDKNNPYLDLCMKQPEPFFYAQAGFEKGIQQCRDSFRCHRWNCTTHKDHRFKLFGVGMARGKHLFLISMIVIQYAVFIYSFFFFNTSLNSLRSCELSCLCETINSRWPFPSNN